MTFQELQDAVSNRIIDLPPTVLGEVPRLVNSAIKSLQKRHNFVQMKREMLVSTTISTRVLGAVPDEWKEPRDRPYVRDDLGRIAYLTWAASEYDAEAAFGHDEDLDVGHPAVLAQGDEAVDGTANLLVYPFPDGLSLYPDGEYPIVVPYFGFTDPLTGATDTNWFTENAEDYIIAKATTEAFAVNWDEKKADYWAGKAMMEQRDVIMADKKRWLATGAGSDTLVPYQGQFTPRLGQ